MLKKIHNYLFVGWKPYLMKVYLQNREREKLTPKKIHDYFFEEDAEMSRTDMLFGGLFGLSVVWAAFVVIMVGVSG